MIVAGSTARVTARAGAGTALIVGRPAAATVNLQTARVTIAAPALTITVGPTVIPLTTVDVAVEIQFTPGVWTDVSAWILTARQPVTMSRGRPDEFADTQPGKAGLTLNNTDGRFTGQATGPYAPNVAINRPVRLSYLWRGQRISRWAGNVDAWPTTWPEGVQHVEAQITATDVLKRLARYKQLPTVLSAEILFDKPVAFWPMSDPDGVLTDASGRGAPPLAPFLHGAGGSIGYGGQAPPTTSGAVAFGRVVDPNGGVGVSGGSFDTRYLGGIGRQGLTPETFTLEAWYALAPDQVFLATGMTIAWLADDAGNRYVLEITAAVGGVLRLRDVNQYNALEWTIGTAVRGNDVDSAAHHVAVTVTPEPAGTVALALYYDGVFRGRTTNAGSASYALHLLGVGAASYQYNPDVMYPFNGSISNVAVYDRALPADRIVAHWHAGNDGFAGERSDARFLRWARLAGITDAAAAPAGSTLSGQDSAGQNPVTLMQDVVKTEQGRLNVDPAGVLRAQPRSARYNQIAVFTIPAGSIREDVLFVLDDSQVVNDLTLTRPTGDPKGVRSVNGASINGAGGRPGIGTYQVTETTLHQTDAQLTDAGQWRVGQYGQPAYRISSVTINLLTLNNPTLISAILAADLGDLFTITGLPASAPVPSVSVCIEGIADSVGAGVWDVTFNTSPATYGQAWILGDPVNSILGSTTLLAF